ncbi:glycosyl hydrolase family 92-domain-containing protein [Crepidotus variabilis]|uniref:Glycosyl hydrolase family 92-domain-containing protein n=1 Tax=Crepidotus variabilis TaxID=179855 RepID=A0A9P6JP35_9AGAR|nr:glycosyl hydrolase family 92-domain-containing protein [Crepidotus variabilis]
MKIVDALFASQLLIAICAIAATPLTNFVNLFVGTLGSGNAFPGSAVPHAMAKVGIDVNTTPRQAGYLSDNSSVSGISLMHDEGTGGNAAGGYGIFPLFPLMNCSFSNCPVGLAARSALRAAGKDAGSPGYFTTTFVNNIQIEATSTRRAGLIRFTYPSSSTNNVVVVDLSNDLQRSFHGGSLDITPQGRVKLGGTYMQSYGPDNYTAYGCYDFINTSSVSAVKPVQLGTFQSNSTSQPTSITITPLSSNTTLNFPYTSSTNPTQAGALLSFSSSSVTARFGVSFVNADQACRNAEEEVPTWDWDAVRSASQTKWENILGRVKVDTVAEDATVVQLLYSSLYRVSLVPANLTGENPYWKSDYPFYDALFCSWDTFRTVHPLLSITSPYEWSEIVNTYIDGWRNTGYIPECRSNTKAGYVQGGSNGMPILGDFISKYAKHAGDLKVSTDDLYQALVATAENTPPDWYRVGRQNTAWKTFGYIPTDWTDPSGSTGLPTREGSRALEYALGDFAVRQAAKTLGKSATDISKYANRSMNFVNHWDSSLLHDGFKGFMQRRYPNGTFAYSPPDACSPVDPVGHSCARGSDNNVGFYESSSWEYSFFAPHSMSTIIKLMGGDQTFLSRVDQYFSKGYFLAGNEPSFQMPWAYHYANRPDLTALRVRNVVYKNFNTGHSGIPGNDDSGAMGALLSFHLLGLYPVVSTNQLLISAPFFSSYTITNPLLGTSTTVRVVNFNKNTLTATPPAGSNIYVQSVTVKGVKRPGICWIEWENLVGGGEIVIELGPNPLAGGCSIDGTDNQRPSSLETGGF